MSRVVEILRADWLGIAMLFVFLWGWTRWVRHSGPKSTLSLIGFTLATLSGLLAISSMFYAEMTGGFAYYDRRLLRIFRWGGLLSLGGVAFSIVGIRKSNALRWHSLGFSLGMLCFWFLSAMGE
jgi:hypothetical protein